MRARNDSCSVRPASPILGLSPSTQDAPLCRRESAWLARRRDHLVEERATIWILGCAILQTRYPEDVTHRSGSATQLPGRSQDKSWLAARDTRPASSPMQRN